MAQGLSHDLTTRTFIHARLAQHKVHHWRGHPILGSIDINYAYGTVRHIACRACGSAPIYAKTPSVAAQVLIQALQGSERPGVSVSPVHLSPGFS